MSKHNPLAFPVQFTLGERTENHDGMTLRDWYAGQALPALVTVMDTIPTDDPTEIHTAVADHAYLLADAMLARRQR